MIFVDTLVNCGQCILPTSCIYFHGDPWGTERKDLSSPKTWATDELAKEWWEGRERQGGEAHFTISQAQSWK